MKLIILCFGMAISFVNTMAQTDREQLSLAVSNAEAQNQQKLKEYVWKRKSQVFIESQLKLTTVTEFSYTPEGKLNTKIIDATTTVKKKPGIRGAAQENAAESKLDYIEKALALAMSYTFMSKGEMIDFFSKATITKSAEKIIAIASDVHVSGDKLEIHIDPKSNLYLFKKFESLLGNEKVAGKLNYENFQNGTNHISTTTLNLPAQKMDIEAQNQDYTIRIK
ncbi:MAG TPA: hypothetical protein PLO59_00880 [Bacteroidia bacterium]|nr:hypothetical protein [Bacteroidia bacterium]